MPKYKPNIQLDVDDPYNERANAAGNQQLKLNKAERAIVNRRQLAQKALDIFVTRGVAIDEVGEELGMTRDDIHSMFLHGEPELKAAIIKRTIDMYLDLEGGHTKADMLETLGITQYELSTLVKSEEFEEAYNEYFLEIASHPTIKAVQHQLVEDLLPRAFRELQALLGAESENVRMKVIFEIFKLAGVRPVEPSKTQRRDFADFLERKSINVDLNITIPDQYADAMDAVVVDPVSPSDASGSQDNSQTLALEDGTQ